jgi:hypothetical protein
MKASHFHAEGLDKLEFNYNLNVKYFSKYRNNGLAYLERKLQSIPSFHYCYGTTETTTQHAFRQSGERNNSHYHLLVSADNEYEGELIEIVKGRFTRFDRQVLVKLKDNTSITGFKDQYVTVRATRIVSSGSEYYLEPIIDILCSAKYSFKACERGINTFFIQKKLK